MHTGMTLSALPYRPRCRTGTRSELPVGELVRLRAGVAELVILDPVYAPIFERLDREIAMRELTDPVARARAIAAAHSAKD
jgi:hypothetical protein